MNKLKKRRKGGFTLIEMVVVIAIVVIIAAIAIPQALKAINKSKASTDVANARTYAGEIMSKVANNEITMTSVAADANPVELTSASEAKITPAEVKLTSGDKFFYRYSTVSGEDKIEILIGKDAATAKTNGVIYPTAADTRYSSYVK